MYRRNYPDLEQAYKSIKKRLLDNPAIGVPLKSAPDFRLYTTEPIADEQGETQGFYVVYDYDLDHIYMHSVRKVNF